MDLFADNSPIRAGKTSPITKSAKLTDLRVLCKNFGLSPSGSKKTILNRLYSHGALRPTETTPQKPPQNDTFTKASKKEDLENACRQLNLKTSGNKDDLIRRLKYFKKRLESIKQNEEEIKKANFGGSQVGSYKQYSDYEVLQANARMVGKPFKFHKRNSGSVLQISNSIVDIINLIEKPKHHFAEGKTEVAEAEKAVFFGSFNLKPVFHQNTVIQLDETENSEDADMDDFTDPLADVPEFSNAALDYNEEKIDVNENFTANDIIDPLEVKGFTSAITQVTDTLEKYDLTFLSDSGIDEESNVSDSSSSDSSASDSSDDEGTTDIDAENLSMIKVIEFVEDAIENIVSVGAGSDGGEVIEEKNEKSGSGLFFAWGSFQNDAGSPEKIKFIV